MRRDRDNTQYEPKGLDLLRQSVFNDPRTSPYLGPEDNVVVPALPVSNQYINELIRSDPNFNQTNVGANPAAYIDPRYKTSLTRTTIPSESVEGNVTAGEYYPDSAPRFLWANAAQPSGRILDTLVHENIHANTHERPNYYPSAYEAPRGALGQAARFLAPAALTSTYDEYKRSQAHSPYLHDEIMEAVKNKMPIEHNIGYGPTEPAAWSGAREAMLPSGQMPIQEEMNRRGLGALYAHMTTAGPVATRLPPSILQRLQDYMSGEPSEEPYELRGNEVEKARKRK